MSEFSRDFGVFYDMNVLEWWSFWLHVSRENLDKKGNVEGYYIDYQALPIAFDIFGVKGEDERREVLGIVTDIAAYHKSSAPLSVEQVFGWEEIK